MCHAHEGRSESTHAKTSYLKTTKTRVTTLNNSWNYPNSSHSTKILHTVQKCIKCALDETDKNKKNKTIIPNTF